MQRPIKTPLDLALPLAPGEADSLSKPGAPPWRLASAAPVLCSLPNHHIILSGFQHRPAHAGAQASPKGFLTPTAPVQARACPLCSQRTSKGREICAALFLCWAKDNGWVSQSCLPEAGVGVPGCGGCGAGQHQPPEGVACGLGL